jgi:ribonuclease J
VLFSSRVIPGNEKAIYRLQNQLVRRGVEVVTDRDAPIHVSGHPARDELTEMYQLVRPRIAIPVHGEARHLREHAALARTCQVSQALANENGAMVRLAPGPAEVVEHVSTGRLGVDGMTDGTPRLVPVDGEMLRNRRRMVFNGSAVATVVMDGAGRLMGDPQLTALGLLDAVHEAEHHDAVVRAVRAALNDLPQGARRDDGAVREAARRAVRRTLKDLLGHKPVTDVHLVRV